MIPGFGKIFTTESSIDPEFGAVFKAKTCMLSDPDKCIQIIEKMHNDKHVFSRDEFDLFIERCTYNKTKSCLATDNGKLSNVFEIMFGRRTLNQEQFDRFIGCCVLKKTMPMWVDIFLANSYLAGLHIDKLAIVHCPANIISDAQTNLKINVQYIMHGLSWHYQGINGHNNNNWKKLPANKIDADLLNMVIGLKGNPSLIHHIVRLGQIDKTIDDMLNSGIVPNDQTVKLISKHGLTTPNILKHLANHNLVNNNDIIRTLCKNDMMMILNHEYKIPFGTNVFNIMLEEYSCNRELTPEMVQELKQTYGAEHIDYSLSVCQNVQPYGPHHMPLFSFYKFWEYLNLAPDDHTFILACQMNVHDLFKLCTEKYSMVPTIEHLNVTLGQIPPKGASDKYAIVASILVYHVVPDANSFKSLCAHKANTYDDNIFDLLIKFGLLINYDDIVYALERGIIIANLERFGIAYDSKLYYHLFINGIEITDELIGKFTIDSGILKLRRLCGRSVTFEKVRKVMLKYHLKLDHYCIDNAAHRAALSGDKRLLFSLIDLIDVPPPPTTFVILSGTTDIYHKTIKYYNIDSTYMEATYDVVIPE